MAKAAKKRISTAVLHAKAGNRHVVGVKDLHVMLLRDGNGWFAQGIEIDYASGGESLGEAKKNFEDGLAATIKEHVARFGTIEKLLVPAPSTSWREYYESPVDSKALYTTVEAFEFLKKVKGIPTMQFPFGAVRFIKAESARA